jgi:hypothetical protein
MCSLLPAVPQNRHSAAVHSCKYRWLQAPATNNTASIVERQRTALHGCQHRTEIPDNLQ